VAATKHSSQVGDGVKIVVSGPRLLRVEDASALGVVVGGENSTPGIMEGIDGVTRRGKWC
jgi:hypothetical protein